MFTRQEFPQKHLESAKKVYLALLVTLLMHLLCPLPAGAQIPVLFSDPEDGGTFSGQLTITFLQPMQDTIAITFSGTGGVSFTSAWQGGIPGMPNIMLVCTPNDTLAPGSVVTWTVNPSGTGFTTTSGDVIPTTSGTFVVSGQGGNVGGGDENSGNDAAPDCPVNTASLPFSKTIAVCISLATGRCYSHPGRLGLCTVRRDGRRHGLSDIHRTPGYPGIPAGQGHGHG
ncbi:hypothetical protein ACFL6U_00830 [Planctomycetota bacterium]